MIALILGVEGWIGRHWERFTDPVAFAWRFALESAASEARAADILIAGDSLAKHGMIPPVIESGSGRSAWNIAGAASPAPVTYFALRRALDDGARPRAVVVEFKPGILAGGPKLRPREWAETLTAREAVDLLTTARSADLAAEVLVGALLPSYRARHDVRATALSALRGEPPRVPQLNAICRRNWTLHDGANIAAARPGYDGVVSEDEHRRLLSDRFAVNGINRLYIRRLLKLTQSRGIPTYVLLTPFVPELRDRRASTGAEAKYSAFIESLREGFPHVIVLDARGSGYPPSAFVDPSHLNRVGAVALSLDVADVLSRPEGIPPSRWVVLPPFRARPDPVPLEDVEQSREHLGIRWAR